MTTQDTITIALELGEWLHSLALVPRAGSAQPQRYTAEAARGLLEAAFEARESPPLSMGARILELEDRCEQLGKLRGEALDTVSRLGKQLNTAEAQVSELQGDLVDGRDLAETKASAQASRIRTLRTQRTELEANLRTSKEYNADLVEENRATKELLREATETIENMAAKGFEADVDTLEAELAAPSGPPADGTVLAFARAWLAECLPGECLSYDGCAWAMTRDRRGVIANITQSGPGCAMTVSSPEYRATAALTPATTPEENKKFDES